MSPLWAPAGPLWPDAGQLGVGGVPAGVTVTVKRRELVSKPGATKPSMGPWSGAGSHTVDSVGLDRTVSSEIRNQAGDDVEILSTVWGPTDADIAYGDRLYFPSGIVVEVVGIPNREPNMINGWMPPMSVPVRVTHG